MSESLTPTQAVTPTQSAPKRRWSRRHPVLTVLLALIVLGGISSALSSGNKSGSSVASANNPSAPAAASKSTPPASHATPPASDMTVAQEQAVRSAKDYLSMSGFSRTGLINQLSSAAGDGYAEADAIVAVDHLQANWNKEAVESAKNYLSMSGFSRAGLIEQLTSAAGDGFTHAQAVYAANAVGL